METFCYECGNDNGKPLHSKTQLCYKCFLKDGGPGFSFIGGGGYTRQTFHDQTTAEVIRQNSAKQGSEYSGSSWYSGPT